METYLVTYIVTYLVLDSQEGWDLLGQQEVETSRQNLRALYRYPAYPAKVEPKIVRKCSCLVVYPICCFSADPEVALFFAMVTTMGFASGIINGYLFLYLQELGKPTPTHFCSDLNLQ